MSAAMVTCPHCGGTKRAYTSTARGLFWRPCGPCGGIGQILRVIA